jgi:hypothetical protein
MSETDENEPSSARPNEGLGSDPLHGLLLDPNKVRSDIRMLAHAFKGKGPPSHHIEEIWNRLMLHLRTDAVREIDPETGMNIVNEKMGADISIKAAGMLGRFLEMFVKDEQLALGMMEKEAAKSTTINIGAIGSISMGQEPLTPTDAKLQAEDILQRVLSRTKQPEPVRVENKLDDLSSI